MVNAEQAVNLNQQLDLLNCDFRVDTTSVNADEVSAKVKCFIDEVINEIN